MVHSHPGRTCLAVAIAALLLTSCTQSPETMPVPGPVPPAAKPAPPASADPAATQAQPQDAARDSARLRALDRVGVAPAGALRACEVEARVRLDADSVALRFTAAFMKLGILPIRLSLPSVDGVAAGPADVESPAPSRLSARATTGSQGDSTSYRVEFRIAPPQQGWAAGDSAVATAHAAGLCTRAIGLAFPAGG